VTGKLDFCPSGGSRNGGWPSFAILTDRGSMSDVTRILSQIEQGDPQAAEKLLPLVYNERFNSSGRKLVCRSRRRESQPYLFAGGCAGIHNGNGQIPLKQRIP
jgi:hypothetical protein